MKQEAIKRLKMLKVSNNVIKDFEKDGVVYYSERQNAIMDGILYWVSNEDRFVDEIKDLEMSKDCLVYHAQLLHTEFGKLLSLLYVSKDKSEWELDIEDLKNGRALAYVVNLDDPTNSEFGYIGISPKNGGITRKW